MKDGLARFEGLLARFAGQRILVLGDVILDRYWWGDASRLSPEAPVPVLRKRTATVRPGGAANTAANLVALGASAKLVGVVGADSAAEELSEALRGCGVDPAFLLQSPQRPTTTKTRIVALHQHVVRVDDEETAPIAESEAVQVARYVASAMDAISAIVISDYAKGFLTPSLLRQVMELAKAAGKPVFVDPKGADYSRYAGAALLKPNRLELSLFSGRPVASHADTLEAGSALLPKLGGSKLLVTEGADGMTLFRPGVQPEYVHPAPRQVLDVTGAGDTVLAALALSLAAGADHRDAMVLATYSAVVAIATLGTAAVTAEAVRDALRSAAGAV
jgi:D-beta-D-heptose 7-phosphate kinase/D-beta-D-heptose 1-phosphate adenosyltransferase